jgi:hypothetical protein
MTLRRMLLVKMKLLIRLQKQSAVIVLALVHQTVQLVLSFLLGLLVSVKPSFLNKLAIELFGSSDSMIRFDMSEYMEKHAVAKLGRCSSRLCWLRRSWAINRKGPP